MTRNASAVWRGSLKAGKGEASTESGVCLPCENQSEELFD
jgi:hypothetical protein